MIEPTAILGGEAGGQTCLVPNNVDDGDSSPMVSDSRTSRDSGPKSNVTAEKIETGCQALAYVSSTTRDASCRVPSRYPVHHTQVLGCRFCVREVNVDRGTLFGHPHPFFERVRCPYPLPSTVDQWRSNVEEYPRVIDM